MDGLVLGRRGQVGQSLKSVLNNAAFLDRSELDLADIDDIQSVLENFRPDYIINAAAYTAVDDAESEEQLATQVNGEAVVELSRLAAARAIPLVHISTDYVFPGSAKLPYREDDETGPINAYGRSKLVGECPFFADCPANQWLLRCSWVFSEYGDNFVKTMLRLADREQLQVVDDQVSRPTYAGDLASVIGRFIDAWKHGRPPQAGTYHCASSGVVTRYEFAKHVFERATKLGVIERAPKLIAVETKDYPSLASRPRYSVLDTTKLERCLEVDLPEWQAGIERTLEALALPKQPVE